MVALNGLHRKDHVLELNRLMLRAESVEQRISLLRVLQVGAITRYSFSESVERVSMYDRLINVSGIPNVLQSSVVLVYR